MRDIGAIVKAVHDFGVEPPTRDAQAEGSAVMEANMHAAMVAGSRRGLLFGASRGSCVPKGSMMPTQTVTSAPSSS